MTRNDDEMITIGGGDIDEMELLVRRLKGANDMVEELPVIATEEDDTSEADEPIEISIGGDDEDDFDEDYSDEDDSDDGDYDEDSDEYTDTLNEITDLQKTIN